ncbi:hypothetical protein HELRODRAFT_172987 [Helobdella robusta]|uniref:Uncharacterized protein n=1 Tax=Helobdella robusta TaxID=6412 RepID=T1F690_HELRO|nr:hypothetical protein HELRODRAFT_172987 [Helobdella robusta]ESO03952.1 hypothetical protein HELRODRAFT_172987 [Helobdella robusta]
MGSSPASPGVLADVKSDDNEESTLQSNINANKFDEVEIDSAGICNTRELKDIARNNNCCLMSLPKLFEVHWTQFNSNMLNAVPASWHCLLIFFKTSKTKKPARSSMNFANRSVLNFVRDGEVIREGGKESHRKRPEKAKADLAKEFVKCHCRNCADVERLISTSTTLKSIKRASLSFSTENHYFSRLGPLTCYTAVVETDRTKSKKYTKSKGAELYILTAHGAFSTAPKKFSTTHFGPAAHYNKVWAIYTTYQFD